MKRVFAARSLSEESIMLSPATRRLTTLAASSLALLACACPPALAEPADPEAGTSTAPVMTQSSPSSRPLASATPLEVATPQAKRTVKPSSAVLPYTGATALPSDPRPGKLTVGWNERLSFGARVKVGWSWPAEGVLMMNDFTGNRRADLLTFFIEDDNVKIRLYEGASGGSVRTVGVIGHGWNEFDYVTAGDVNADGYSDLIGRKANGELWLYTARGNSWFNPGYKIGHGWQGMRTLTFSPAPPGGQASVLATSEEGRLYRYPFVDRNGTFGRSVVYGKGWRSVSRILPAGDLDGNGQSDFYATDVEGRLLSYEASAKGDSYRVKQIGNGWNSMTQMLAVPAGLGAGIYGIDARGDLYFYPVRYVRPEPPKPPSPWLQPVTSITPPGWTVTPQMGWNGTKVRQVRLSLGQGAPLNASMTFDRGTYAAVQRFQRRAGLRATGVVDQGTWSRMTSRPWTMDNWRMPPRVGLDATRSQRVEAMISFARLALGSPYTWGGAGPWEDGFDCSGMALQAIYAAGYDPQPINVVAHAGPTYRTSKELYSHAKLESVPFGQRQRGDLVFWQGRYGIYHVAVYLGDNQIIESYYGHTRQRALYDWGRIAPYVKRVAH
ncbi:MAG: NlpC/P60 family protein [Actinomycetaceae bacterium]|nr:NlpC/P60 family protein [Actinomycetaceae bacterium]